MEPTSRDIPIDLEHAALLMIDVQNYGVDPKGGAFAKLGGRELDDANRFLNLVHAATLPNQARLLRACRDAGIEVIYTVIENLTLDGRDRSLDYKISGIDVPKGSCDAKVPDIVAPLADEIVIPKTSSSVFISTNIDYLLRNLRIRSSSSRDSSRTNASTVQCATPATSVIS